MLDVSLGLTSIDLCLPQHGLKHVCLRGGGVCGLHRFPTTDVINELLNTPLRYHIKQYFDALPSSIMHVSDTHCWVFVVVLVLCMTLSEE